MSGQVEPAPTIYTVGHSTRSLDEFLALLDGHGIRTLADVRTVPKSRRHPQFVREALAESLDRAGVRYVHLPQLGGLRRPRRASPNDGWRNESFRGYADYLATEEFQSGLARLLALAEGDRGGDVHRGGALALPPLAARRRATGPWGTGRAHRQPERQPAPFADSVRPGRRPAPQLSSRAKAVNVT